MKFIKDTTWAEVFAGWRDGEASDPGWIECATKIKGWPDWETWRCFTASQIGAAELSWQLYEFSDPMNEIPAMLLGPYTGWQSRVTNINHSTFSDLINIPEQFKHWSNVHKILSIMDNFPHPTELIGIVRGDIGKIVCLEGHHRATAVAIAAKLGKNIDFNENPRIALAKISADQTFVFDEVLKRGSTKNPKE